MCRHFFFHVYCCSQDVIKIQAKENMDLSKLLSDIAAKKASGGLPFVNCEAKEFRKLAVCLRREAGSCPRYLEISFK